MLGILIYALLSGEYPLNAAKDHIQMNEKVSKHVFELDQSRGQYSNGALDIVRKLLRKDPQRRLQSLSSIKNEAFFQNEIEMFTDKALQTEKELQSSKNQEFSNDLNESEKRAIISENFWNPYVIMENYSPLQMLFDEIYSIKQKQQGLEVPIRKSKSQKTMDLPPPPPPPPATCPGREPIVNNAFEDDSSTSTLSSQKSDDCHLPYKSSYIDDYEEDDDVRDFDIKIPNDHFTQF